MSYTLLSESTPVARKAHRCIWCGERIAAGERYTHERSIYDGGFQNHHWHPECRADANADWLAGGDQEFTPHSAPRPVAVGASEGSA